MAFDFHVVTPSAEGFTYDGDIIGNVERLGNEISSLVIDRFPSIARGSIPGNDDSLYIRRNFFIFCRAAIQENPGIFKSGVTKPTFSCEANSRAAAHFPRYGRRIWTQGSCAGIPGSLIHRPQSERTFEIHIRLAFCEYY